MLADDNGTCEYCGAALRWITNKATRCRFPLEVAPDAARGQWRISESTMTAEHLPIMKIASAIARKTPLYVNHLVFCPGASSQTEASDIGPAMEGHPLPASEIGEL